MMLRPYSGEEAFLEILPFLPPQASGILEIGPGSGRFAALLAKHYPGCAIHLIDGDRSVPDAKKIGYSNGIVPWNDVTDAAVHVIREAPLAKVFGYTPDSVPGQPAARKRSTAALKACGRSKYGECPVCGAAIKRKLK